MRLIFLFLVCINLVLGGDYYVKFETDTVFLFLQKDKSNNKLVLTQNSLPAVKSNGDYCYISDEIYDEYKKEDLVFNYPKIPDSLCKNKPPLIEKVKILKAIKNENFYFQNNKIDLKVDGKYASSRGMCGMVASVILSIKINEIDFFKDFYMENWCSSNINVNQVEIDFLSKQVILYLSYANLIGINEKFEEIKFVKIPFLYFEKNTISHLSLSDLAKLLNVYCDRNYDCHYHNIKVGFL